MQEVNEARELSEAKALTRHEAFEDYIKRISADPAAFEGHLRELHGQLGALRKSKRNHRSSIRSLQRALLDRNNIIRKRNEEIVRLKEAVDTLTAFSVKALGDMNDAFKNDPGLNKVRAFAADLPERSSAPSLVFILAALIFVGGIIGAGMRAALGQ